MVWVFVRLFKRLPLDETVCLHSLRYILKSHTKLWAGILDPPSESSQPQKSPPWSASHHSLKCMLACVELWYMNTWKRSCCTSNHYLLPGTKFRQGCTKLAAHQFSLLMFSVPRKKPILVMDYITYSGWWVLWSLKKLRGTCSSWATCFSSQGLEEGQPAFLIAQSCSLSVTPWSYLQYM